MANLYLFLIILLMTPQNTSQLSRAARFKRILTPQMIQQIIVKYIVNNDPEQQRQERLVYHLRQGYFYILNAYNLPSLSDNQDQTNEEEYFMERVNEYLPDCLRVESYVIEDMRQAFAGIPVSGAIITNKSKDKLLFVQDRRTGKYGLCKGKIAQGETLEECAIREVREETDYRVTKIGKSYEEQVNKNPYTFFEAEVEENNPEVEDKIFQGKNHSREITEYVWWSPQKVKQVLQMRRGGEKFNWPTTLVMKRYLSAQ